MYKDLKAFFKLGIVNFVVISAIAGYGIGFTVEQSFSWLHLFAFIIGTFCISSGSLSMNQIQEVENDSRMERIRSW